MRSFINYSIVIASAGTILLFIGWLLFSQLMPNYYFALFPYAVLFVTLVSLIIHFLLIRFGKSQLQFARLFMIFSTVKILIYGGFLIIGFLLSATSERMSFGLTFLCIYLFFLIIDTIIISRNKTKLKT
jgi:hypothetical protein